jgi:hypothetical protein
VFCRQLLGSAVVRIIHSRVSWFSAHKPGPILAVVIGAATVTFDGHYIDKLFS